MSWQDKYDAYLEKKEKIRSERERRDREKWERKKLAELHRKYKCHVCGKGSDSPQEGGNDFDGYWTNWDKPGDLRKCHTCQKWACGDCTHVVYVRANNYQRTCRKCADKMSRGSIWDWLFG